MIKLDPQGMPALLLDLDGTVRRPKSKNKFISAPDDQELIEGVSEAIAHYRALDWLIIGVTNQGGVEKGYKSLQECFDEQVYTLKLAPIHKIYFCPDFSGKILGFVDRYNQRILPLFDEYLSFRKPSPGMAEYICDTHSIRDAWMVGDRDEDRDFATNAGISFCWADIWQKHFRGEEVGDLAPDIKLFLGRKKNA